MRSLTIEIDDIPPTVNHSYHYNRRGNFYMSQKAKRFKALARIMAIRQAIKSKWDMIEKGEFFVMEVRFTFENRRFPDPNNLLKILIDSFEGVVFENDKWLLPRVMSIKIGGKPHTKVVFKSKS